MMGTTKLAEALHTTLENLKLFGEAVDGYRQQCIDRGYTAAAAETMAVEVHGYLIANLRAALDTLNKAPESRDG